MFWPTIRYVALTNLTNRWSYFLARRRARDSYAGGATQRRWQLAETKPQPQPERAAPAKSCGQIERLAQSATHSRSWKIDSIRRTVRIPVKTRLRIQLPGAILSSHFSVKWTIYGNLLIAIQADKCVNQKTNNQSQLPEYQRHGVQPDPDNAANYDRWVEFVRQAFSGYMHRYCIYICRV